MKINQKPILHGRDHLCGGADPIPGICDLFDLLGNYEDVVRNDDLTIWWRLGDTFTFASSVADAMADTAEFDSDSPRSLDYTEPSSSNRPTLQVAHAELDTSDDGAVEFNNATTSGPYFFGSSNEVRDVTQFGTTGDKARTVSCFLKVKAGVGAIPGPAVGRWGMDGSGALNVGWVIEVDQSTFVLSFETAGGGAPDVITGPTLTADTWYHVAVTFDGTTYSLYVDGAFVDDVTAGAPTEHADSYGTTIGYAKYDSGATFANRYFYGSVDDVAFYRRVLTATEIARIAGGGTAPGGGGGGPPSGAAGGALDGSYPNPGLAASVAGSGLAESSDVLSVNVDGSTIEISSDSLRVKDDGITAAKIATDAVGSAEIAADAVGSSEIAAGAVGTSELADTAVTPGTYGDSTHVGQFTVDQDGRLTAASNVSVSGGAGAGADGWITDTDTWTYASATTFTIAGVDRTAMFPVGTYLRLKQGGAYKYFVVVASAFSTNTTITLTGGTSYTLANAGITDNGHSYEVNPQDWPTWFAFTSTLTGFTGATTGTIRFAVHGRMVWIDLGLSGTSNATTFTFTLPIATRTSSMGRFAIVHARDNTSHQQVPGFVEIQQNTSVVNAYKNGDFGSTGWTNAGTKALTGQFWYEI